MMQKRTKIIVLLASLLLLAAGLNYIFVGIAGSRPIKQTESRFNADGPPPPANLRARVCA